MLRIVYMAAYGSVVPNGECMLSAVVPCLSHSLSHLLPFDASFGLQKFGQSWMRSSDKLGKRVSNPLVVKC